MKKLLLALLVVFSSICGYSQETEKIDKWDKYTSAGTNNYFYKHFKKFLTSELISKESFSNSKKKIFIEFSVIDGQVENVKTNSTYIPLKKKIIYAFNRLNFDKVSIYKTGTFHNYSIQLIELVNRKWVLNCSSTVLHEVPPICDNCNKRKDYESYNLCFKKKLETYLLANIDSSKLTNIDITKKQIVKSYAEFSNHQQNRPNTGNDFVSIKINLNKNGTFDISNNAQNKILNKEITNVLSGYKFNTIFPATFNSIHDNYTYELKITERRLVKSWLYKTSQNNELANYFKNSISESLINKEYLDDKRNSVSISFSFDKKGKLKNVSSSAKNEELNESLITAFKSFPVKRLKTPKKINSLSKFFFTVIVSEDFKNRIECNNYLFSETLPIIKGCEKSKSHQDLKKCNQTSISHFVRSNFNSTIASKLNLKPGVKRIFVMFKISKTGEIVDIKARAPHEKLTEEAIKKIQKIKVESPAYQMGVPVSIKYSLPIAFRVEKKKTKTKPKHTNPYEGINAYQKRRKF